VQVGEDQTTCADGNFAVYESGNSGHQGGGAHAAQWGQTQQAFGLLKKHKLF